MDETTKQILENQEVILLALSTLIRPNIVKDAKYGFEFDHQIADVNSRLMDDYHLTRKALGKAYIKRWSE